jgi:hypothetical protein
VARPDARRLCRPERHPTLEVTDSPTSALRRRRSRRRTWEAAISRYRLGIGQEHHEPILGIELAPAHMSGTHSLCCTDAD